MGRLALISPNETVAIAQMILLILRQLLLGPPRGDRPKAFWTNGIERKVIVLTVGEVGTSLDHRATSQFSCRYKLSGKPS
jgi:uncharacterized membrane protein (DUF441 family)